MAANTATPPGLSQWSASFLCCLPVLWLRELAPSGRPSAEPRYAARRRPAWQGAYACESRERGVVKAQAAWLPEGDAPGGHADRVEGLVEVGPGVHGGDAVVPAAVEVDALVQAGGVEALGQLPVVPGRLAIALRLLGEPEQDAEAGPEGLDPHRHPGALERLAKAGAEVVVKGVERRVEARLGDLVEQGARGEDGDQVGVEGPAVDGRAAGGDGFHHLAAAGEGGEHRPAADDLAQGRQVGRDAVVALGAARPRPEP